MTDIGSGTNHDFMDKTDIQKHNTVNGQNCEVRKAYWINRWLVLQSGKEVKVVPETVMMLIELVLVAIAILIVEKISVVMVTLIAAEVMVDMVALEIVKMGLVMVKAILKGLEATVILAIMKPGFEFWILWSLNIGSLQSWRAVLC